MKKRLSEIRVSDKIEDGSAYIKIFSITVKFPEPDSPRCYVSLKGALFDETVSTEQPINECCTIWGLPDEEVDVVDENQLDGR